MPLSYRIAMAALLTPVVLAAQQPPTGLDSMASHLARANGRQWFNGAVTVAKGARPAVTVAVGVARRSPPAALQRNSRFRLASVSKQFTAAAILLLEEGGKLRVEDPLATFIPDFPGADRITLHHLLTHTSGVVEISRLPDIDSLTARPRPVDDYIARVAREPLQFTPGTQASYSNTGYMLLSRVIERASGQPFGDYMREHVFGPLGMRESGVLSPGNTPADGASGFVIDANGRLNDAEAIDVTALVGAGALYASADDLARWGNAIAAGRLLRADSWRKMFTAYRDGYGYGWRQERVGERAVWAHGGSVPGFATRVEWHPGDSVFIAVLRNVENLPRTFDPTGMARALARGEAWSFPEPTVFVTLREMELQRLVGQYEVTPSLTLSVATDGRTLTVRAGAQPPLEFGALSATRFRSDRINAVIDFVEENGQVVGLVLHQGGRDSSGKKLTSPRAPE